MTIYGEAERFFMGVASMTGFGRGEAIVNTNTATVEISSVNRKQFDCHVTLPRSLSGLEARIQTVVRAAITRGAVKVSLTLTLEDANAAVDIEYWRVRIDALRTAAAALGLPDDLTASTLVQGISSSTPTERVISTDAAWTVIEPALATALKNLITMRRREGAALLADLQPRFAALQTLVAEIAMRAPAIPAQYRDSLHARIETLLGDQGPTLEADTLARFADRCDISEELTRLSSHFDQADALLADNAPCGRPLDFLCQEFFREINTIGSKANDTAITRCVIAFKTGIEAIREQIQNIE